MDALNTYSVKQLKNIVVTHNASEKVNMIKAYGKMKKPELVEAISKQIKQEHLMKILEALKISTIVSGETMKIKVKRQPTKMNTKMVEEMLMMMEEGGSKVAEKIRKSGMIDEMTAKQEQQIVDDFMKMFESQGEKAMGNVKKSVGMKPPAKKRRTFYQKVVDMNKGYKDSAKFLEVTQQPVFGKMRDYEQDFQFVTQRLLSTKFVKLGLSDYLVNKNTATSDSFIRGYIMAYVSDNLKLKGGVATKRYNKLEKETRTDYDKLMLIRGFHTLPIETQQKIFKDNVKYMIKIPTEFKGEEREDFIKFYEEGIVVPAWNDYSE
jgi:hypothetical protein